VHPARRARGNGGKGGRTEEGREERREETGARARAVAFDGPAVVFVVKVVVKVVVIRRRRAISTKMCRSREVSFGRSGG
jgi:hypothetical protein